MRRFCRALATFLGVCLVLGILLVIFLFWRRGIQAKRPGELETRVLTFGKHKFLVGDKTLRNPLPTTAENIKHGQQNFSHYCFACHGLDAQNTGVPFAEVMSPPVPSLASSIVQSYSDGQLHWVIEYGLWPSGMPAAKGILAEDEIWSIVLYIRHLPPAGSLGEPKAYSGDDAPAGASSNTNGNSRN
jgi:mono/diheme cytochrome c family protein